MSDPAVPDNLASRIQELERRIRNLETSPRLGSSSIKGGKLEVRDDLDRLVGVLGQFDAQVGFKVVDPATGQGYLWAEAGHGTLFPWIAHSWAKPTDTAVTTSASYVTLWQSVTELMAGPELRFTVTVVNDAATTSTLRLLANTVQLGNTKTFAAGTTTATYAISHGKTINSGPWTFELQALRASGAGNVTISTPRELTIGGLMPIVSGGW